MGYRHFDGALVYFNEHEVGQAIREKIADGSVRRQDIFYCGKVTYVKTCQRVVLSEFNLQTFSSVEDFTMPLLRTLNGIFERQPASASPKAGLFAVLH